MTWTYWSFPLDEHRMCLMHWIAMRGDVASARRAIDNNGPVVCESSRGNTMLHLLHGQEGSEEMARLLIEQGADPWKANVDGVCAVDMWKRLNLSSLVALVEGNEASES